MEEVTCSLLSVPPLCSTLLENSLGDRSTSPGLESSLTKNFSYPKKISGSSLNLASIATVPRASSLLSDDQDLSDSSNQQTSTSRSSDLGSTSYDEASQDRLNELDGPEIKFSSVARNLGESAPSEPEVDVIERFRQFGLRFIRGPDRYVHCDCNVPQQLIYYSSMLSEVTMSCQDPLPLCFHYRWAEIKQDFNVDVFGDLQFQDFLLAREQRGPYHGMVHFAGIFANVGYDGRYWYWVLVGDSEIGLIESKHRRKNTFIESLATMVREQMRLHKYAPNSSCPQPMPYAHLYVRADETPFEREPADPPKERQDTVFETDHDDLDEYFDLQMNKPPRIINGQRAPRELSYLQLYCDNYNDAYLRI